jgi:hypothetical protein
MASLGSMERRTQGLTAYSSVLFFFFFGKTGSCHVAQASLELTSLLPPKCWDYRCVPPHLAAMPGNLEE